MVNLIHEEEGRSSLRAVKIVPTADETAGAQA
jgi:hypothetical protein